MTQMAERLRDHYLRNSDHPYRIFEAEVERHLRPDTTLLDAGCGRTAPVLRKYQDRVAKVIGIDLVDFDPSVSGIQLLKEDLSATSVPSSSVDLIMARSVMEHVAEPTKVYAEAFRMLRPGGRFIFLTANLWDYASLIACIIPNRLHPWIVARTEGRAEHDTFPTQYRTNTRRAVYRFTEEAGFEVQTFRRLGQYPGYFMFNGPLFLLATGYEKLISRFEALSVLRGWIFAELVKPKT